MELEALHKACDELRSNIAELAVKLKPIVSPSPELQARNLEGQPAPELVRTPLAEMIHQRCVQVHDFSEQLRRLLRGIEL